MVNLSERQQAILRMVLAGDGPVTGSELARQLGVSLRTVQADIARINSDEQVLISTNRGYLPTLAASTTIREYARDAVCPAPAHQIMVYLLAGEELTVDDLALALYESTSSVERQLTEVKDILDKHGLTLCRTKGRLRVEGDECLRRRLMGQLVLDEVGPAFSLTEAFASNLKGIRIDEVSDVLQQAALACNLTIPEGYGQDLAVSVTVALFFIKPDSASAGNSTAVTLATDAASAASEPCERRMAREICRLYGKMHPLSPSEEDLDYLASLLAGRVRATNVVDARVVGGMSKEFEIKVATIATSVFADYLIPAPNHLQLHNFALHVYAMIRRAKSNPFADLTITESIRINSPFIYEVSLAVADRLGKELGVKIAQGELGFICVHVGLIILEDMGEQRITIAVAGEDYRGIRRRIIANLSTRLATYVDVTAFDSSSDVDADILVSTGEIPITTGTVIQVSPLFIERDFQAVEVAVTSFVEHRDALKAAKATRFFRPEVFFQEQDLHTREETICFLAKRLQDYGVVGEDFAQSVLRRESMGSTDFFGLFAIPHAMEMNASRTTIATLVTEKGIEWNGSRVNVVLMIALNAQDRGIFMDIYDGIIRQLCDARRISRLTRTKTLEDFLHCMLYSLS